MVKISLAASAILASAAVTDAALYERCETLFKSFQQQYHKKYSTTDEEASRLGVFCDNMKKADDLNVINGHRSFGWKSKYADRTFEEFSVVLGRSQENNRSERELATAPVRKPKLTATAEPAADWRKRGVVTPVKNQGQCGSCWAHSVTEQIESQWALDGNALWEFSVQQVASCTTNCFGCGGGQTYYGYEYVMGLSSGVGLGSGAFAPYVESMYNECLDKRCTQSCDSLNVTALETEAALTGYYANVVGYDYVIPPCTGACNAQNMTQMAVNIAEYGPASICVNAENWNLYEGGVLTSAACGGFASKDIDHCVQVVGFDATAPTPYWMVRNSWATDWGENGYIYLEMGPDVNTCSMGSEATFVTLTTTPTR